MLFSGIFNFTLGILTLTRLMCSPLYIFSNIRQSPAIQAPMGLDPVQPIYQKAFSEVPIQNSKSFHYGGAAGGGPGSLAGTGPGSVQYGMDRPYPPTGIMRVPEFSMSQSQHSIQQNSIDHQRIMFLEQKMQRLEQDNHILYQQNAKMKNQYTQGLSTFPKNFHQANFQSLRSNFRLGFEQSSQSRSSNERVPFEIQPKSKFSRSF